MSEEGFLARCPRCKSAGTVMREPLASSYTQLWEVAFCVSCQCRAFINVGIFSDAVQGFPYDPKSRLADLWWSESADPDRA